MCKTIHMLIQTEMQVFEAKHIKMGLTEQERQSVLKNWTNNNLN